MKINRVAIVGMGALGLMYGEQIQKKIGRENVTFVMDSRRYERNKNSVFTVNGEETEFSMLDCSEAKPVDYVIVATKQNGLEDALDVMQPLINEHTIIMSVMNGITSEEIIASRYGDRNIVYCVALGMDAMREGTDLTFKSQGKLQIGIYKEEQREALEAVKEFLDLVMLKYEEKEDIKHALWGKLVMNVGINQTCTVFEATYQEVFDTKEYFEHLCGAMREVMAVAKEEGVFFSEEEFNSYLALMRTLNPDGYPSMRQDAVAKRKSEVDLFAGTIVKLGKKHGIDVPVNNFYYQKILDMEAKY